MSSRRKGFADFLKMEANALKHLTIIHDVRVAEVGVYRVNVQIIDESEKIVAKFEDLYEKKPIESVTKSSMRKAFELAKKAGADTVEVRSNAGIEIKVPARLRPAEDEDEEEEIKAVEPYVNSRVNWLKLPITYAIKRS